MDNPKVVEQIKLFLQALGTIDDVVAESLACYCSAFLLVDAPLQKALKIFLQHSAEEMADYLRNGVIPDWVKGSEKVEN